jgi:hypothetical protein
VRHKRGAEQKEWVQQRAQQPKTARTACFVPVGSAIDRCLEGVQAASGSTNRQRRTFLTGGPLGHALVRGAPEDPTTSTSRKQQEKLAVQTQHLSQHLLVQTPRAVCLEHVPAMRLPRATPITAAEQRVGCWQRAQGGFRGTGPQPGPAPGFGHWTPTSPGLTAGKRTALVAPAHQ